MSQLKLSPFKRGPSQAEICGLTPFTQYTIRVAVRPLRRSDGDGYLSEWRYLQNVRTNPSGQLPAHPLCTWRSGALWNRRENDQIYS